MNRSDDKNGIDNDLITETREFIKKGLFSEADCLLTCAVEAEARSIIVGLEWIKISSTQGNHQQAQERLELVKYTHQNVDWSEVEVELLLRARMFERCIEKLTEYRDRSTDIIKWQKKIKRVEKLIAIQARFDSEPRVDLDYVSYCVNLDEHTEKWTRSKKEADSANILTERIAGLKGSHLPSKMFSRFGKGTSPNFKGTLGCFISHFHVWEKFLNTSLNYALVLEDDFRPLVRFPNKLKDLGIPSGFDICWINQRMAIPHAGELLFAEVGEVVKARSSAEWRACGTDGYILSRDGAAKLLNYVQEDGFYGDVDWRMVAYSLNHNIVTKLSIHDFAKKALQAHFGIVRSRKPLVSFCASPGLIGLVNSGSGREEQNSGVHAHESI